MITKIKREPFVLNGTEVKPGTRVTIDLPAAQLYTHTPLHIPIEIVHGKQPGPTLLVSGAIHGDEINGVEIVRRLLTIPAMKKLKGTLIAVPIVNVFGFIHKNRYLPDRRDLNRCFPGSPRGTLGARLAHLFSEEVLRRCTHGIDLHTAAIYRDNFPQVRANLNNDGARDMAMHFGVPIVMHSGLVEGSLRSAADAEGIPIITYEAGEALRFDEKSIVAGVKGIIFVMRHLGMLHGLTAYSMQKFVPDVAEKSIWVRAEQDGILRSTVRLGKRVEQNDLLAYIGSPFGAQDVEIRAPESGIIVGRQNMPLVNEGEALFHIAQIESKTAASQIKRFQDTVLDDGVVPTRMG